MPLTFFKGNQKSTGCGMGFHLNSKDGAIYISLVQQSGWNPAKRLGTFAGQKTNLKFNINEVGTLIDAIQRCVACKFFHKNKSDITTNIDFTPYIGDNQEYKGFGLTVRRTVNNQPLGWKFTIGPGEVIVIIEWLRFALERCYNAIYSQDKKDFEARVKEKEMTQVVPNSEEQVPAESMPEEEVPKVSEPEKKQEGDDFDF